LDGKYNTGDGIRLSRTLLRDIANIGIPVATEFLGTTLEPQYIADLISWGCIGARTVESQIHRHLVSGLSMPVGFKNSSDGAYKSAICACVCAKTPRSFIGINEKGQPGIIKTSGNNDVCIVLRGSYETGPNDFMAPSVVYDLELKKLNKAVIIDCSHGNSNKSIKGQLAAIERSKLLYQRKYVVGIMIESHLEEGKTNDLEKAKVGISITDPCVGWETTREVLLKYDSLVNSYQSEISTA